MTISREDNPGYRAIRTLFRNMGLDAPNYGSALWNPLRQLVKPSGKAVLKPNLVRHNNGHRSEGSRWTDCLLTHGSVIRAVFDYVAKAMEGAGCILIADAPVQGCEWDEVIRITGLDDIVDYARSAWPNVDVELVDLRLRRSIVKKGQHIGSVMEEDSEHLYEEVDLGNDSLLVPIMKGGYEFGVSLYPRHRMKAAHTPSVNKYLFPKALLAADLIVNLPKMKTHKKAGMTGALKNLVGINGHKDYLPHFRFGGPSHGGDEYPDNGCLWKCRGPVPIADGISKGVGGRLFGRTSACFCKCSPIR